MYLSLEKSSVRVYSVLVKILFIVSITVSVYTALFSNHAGYKLLFLLPFFYTLFIYLSSNFIKSFFSVFYLGFIAISFLRYVVLPFFIVFSGFYEGTSPSHPISSSYSNAILLMCYELIVSVILIHFLEKRYKKKFKDSLHHGSSLELYKYNLTYKNYPVFYISIIFLIVFVVLNRNSWSSIINNVLSNDFLSSSIDETGFSETGNILSGLLFQLLKSILFVVFSCRIIYISNKSGKITFFNALLLILLVSLNTALIFGLNRMKLVMTLLTSLIFLWSLSSLKTKLLFYLIPTLFIGSLVLNRVTEARQYYSYFENKAVINTHNLQVYLGGPYNVAIALEMDTSLKISDKVDGIAYDFLRPMLGINFLIGDGNIKSSSMYFNDRYHLSSHVSQIIPMIGQGHFYLGPIFAPLLGCLFIWLSYLFIGLTFKHNNIFRYYFLLMITLRLSYFMGQNSINLVNNISFTLFPYLILEWINSLVKKRI